jgi:transaldolase / glucose-6-phosphate isomerase
LIGVDIRQILDRAGEMAKACALPADIAGNPGVALGAALGELALAGRDKVTFLASPSLESLPDWIEQLVAESLGKDGQGIVPVAGEPLGAPDVYGGDRVFVHLSLEGENDTVLEKRIAALEASGQPMIRIVLSEKSALGQEFFRWEIATAAAGAVLRVHPFNQPDVQLAKELARKAMETAGAGGATASGLGSVKTDELAPALAAWLEGARPGDYLALQAYLAPTPEMTDALTSIRLALRDRLRLATTAGYGPRFLHSTGQLHKGGPGTGLFLQLIDDPPVDLSVPETGFTFGALIRAQATGDLEALHQRGRRVLRVDLGADPVDGLRHLVCCL